MSSHLLNRQRGIVVAERWRARDLGPFRALQRLAHAVNAFGEVLGAGTTRNHGVFAAVGPQLQELLAEGDAELLVVGADIGDALGAGRIGVEGDDRDAGRGRRVDRLGHRRDVGNRDGEAVDLLGDEVLDDLGLRRRLVLDRPLVDALDIAELLGTLQAAVAREVEERIVHRLGHDHEPVVCGKRRRSHHRHRDAGK
ncbi:hypothetical protein ACVWZ6_001601 [Bradyrhizobium sp. GM6.1]